MAARSIPLAERFWSKVDKAGPDECWHWTGMRVHHSLRYGAISIGPGKRKYAHQVSFFLEYGRWQTPGLVVMHECDNPICVNPKHLREGTRGDNNRDARTKGRSARGDANCMSRPEVRLKVTGENNPAAKLTDEQVREIKRKWAEGTGNNSLAREYRVSPATTSRIINGHIRKSA